MRQVACSVVNFSSQYGRDDSKAYTAANLAGDSSKYPQYGDFMEAFVLRTYGPWWKQAPSAPSPIGSQATFISQDFVELEFPTPVFPTEVSIIETYNPGAVVRILACNASVNSGVASGQVRWVTLWEGPPQQDLIPKKSRIFSPPIRKINFPTNLLRLEFNHEGLEYYAELDAVELHGNKPSEKTLLEDRAIGFQVERTMKLLKQLSLTEHTPSEEAYGDFGYFGLLPDEIIQNIVSYLDTSSLSIAAQTCSLLLRHCYDASLYTELNLQPYWNTVDDCTLDGLQTRASRIEKLSLSWTGGCSQLTETSLNSFIRSCGASLVCLRLACCDFVTAKGLQAISETCQGLQELDLQSCGSLDRESLKHLGKLTTLRSINLYRVKTSNEAIKEITEKNRGLQHINLGGSSSKLDAAEAVMDLGRNCADLRSLDLWRPRKFTSGSLKFLANSCSALEEIDVGWANELDSSSGCFIELFEKCTKLKKVFLTANRTVCDRDIVALATHCPLMEQVDILGTGHVSSALIRRVAKSCKFLQFFDLSFCRQIKEPDVKELRMQFPHVAFKQSFTH